MRTGLVSARIASHSSYQPRLPRKLVYAPRVLRLCLDYTGHRNLTVIIHLTSADHIESLYTKKTDIVSFPLQEILGPGKLGPKQTKLLGEIYLCPQLIKSKDYSPWINRKIRDKYPLLITHGILHLLGYNHETDDEFTQMRAIEDYVLKQL